MKTVLNRISSLIIPSIPILIHDSHKAILMSTLTFEIAILITEMSTKPKRINLNQEIRERVCYANVMVYTDDGLT